MTCGDERQLTALHRGVVLIQNTRARGKVGGLSGGRNHPVRIEDEFLRHTRIEGRVTLRRVLEFDDGRVHRIGDMGLVMQDAHHQPAVVFQHGALAGGEAVALRPAEPQPDLQRAVLGVGVRSPGIAGDIQARAARPSRALDQPAEVRPTRVRKERYS